MNPLRLFMNKSKLQFVMAILPFVLISLYLILMCGVYGEFIEVARTNHSVIEKDESIQRVTKSSKVGDDIKISMNGKKDRVVSGSACTYTYTVNKGDTDKFYYSEDSDKLILVIGSSAILDSLVDNNGIPVLVCYILMLAVVCYAWHKRRSGVDGLRVLGSTSVLLAYIGIGVFALTTLGGTILAFSL